MFEEIGVAAVFPSVFILNFENSKFASCRDEIPLIHTRRARVINDFCIRARAIGI